MWALPPHTTAISTPPSVFLPNFPTTSLHRAPQRERQRDRLLLLLGSPRRRRREARGGRARSPRTLVMYNPIGSAEAREPAELPAAVAAELERLEGRLLQLAGAEARRHLAVLGEAGAARVLRAVAESRRVRTLPGFITYLAKREAAITRRDARGVPTALSAPAFISGPSREGQGFLLVRRVTFSVSFFLSFLELGCDAILVN